MSKTARWLDLIAYLLQHRFPVTREEIFAKVAQYRDDAEPESRRRKFERDKDELRALGIQIETVTLPGQAGDEPSTGYRLKARDVYLPYLELQNGGATPERPYQNLLRLSLTQDDVARLDRATRRVAELSSPLAVAAASARRKLAFDLPLPITTVERLLARPLEGEGARSLEVLQRAVAERRAVACTYYAIGRDAEERRTIEPYGLFFSWGRWYCVARCRERQAMRVFRLDRMREAELQSGADASFTVPADFSIRSYVGRAPWELGPAPPRAARVRFGFPESRWVLAQNTGTPVEPLLGDGGAVIEFSVRDAGPFLRWLLTFRAGIEILEPADLAAELAGLRRRVAALYAEARA
jgi:predicted DNA-binding transcriptional regulator YafY